MDTGQGAAGDLEGQEEEVNWDGVEAGVGNRFCVAVVHEEHAGLALSRFQDNGTVPDLVTYGESWVSNQTRRTLLSPLMTYNRKCVTCPNKTTV